MGYRISFLLCLLCLSCATTEQVSEVSTLPTGQSAVSTGTGIVIGRRETVNADGSPASSAFGRPIRGSLGFRNATTGVPYTLHYVDDSAAVSDFYVELPAGDYFTLTTRGCLGSYTDPETIWVLSFTVEPGVVTYVGTFRARVATLVPPRCPTFSIADELGPLLERFKSRHPDLARDVHRSLIAQRRYR